ncbi:unnamed protein product [Pleuronectes platessa]|uniref:Uncharacterized protein n=1 Tax=Pleuronectes platessa TaxID=8262 RepID=A0A9N7V8K9_PLEPL|nr:unnamed protein product [Pleuronectes platessa]
MWLPCRGQERDGTWENKRRGRDVVGGSEAEREPQGSGMKFEGQTFGLRPLRRDVHLHVHTSLVPWRVAAAHHRHRKEKDHTFHTFWKSGMRGECARNVLIDQSEECPSAEPLPILFLESEIVFEERNGAADRPNLVRALSPRLLMVQIRCSDCVCMGALYPSNHNEAQMISTSSPRPK